MPWFLIGGIIGGGLIAGLLFFLVRRIRPRRGPTYDEKFLIVPLAKVPKEKGGNDVLYILSEGRVIRVTPHRDEPAKS